MIRFYPYLRNFLLLLVLLLLLKDLRGQQPVIAGVKAELETTTDSIAYVDILNRLATLYQACQLDSCGVYADEAVKVASRQHYTAGLTVALRNMGSFYAFKPNRYLSYLFYNESLLSARESGDSASVALNLMNIGIYQNYLGYMAQGKAMMDTAMARGQALKNDSIYGLLLANYYVIHAADTTPEARKQAAEALHQAAITAMRYNNQREILYTRLLQANEQVQLGKVKESMAMLQETLQNAEEQGLYYLCLYGAIQLAGYKSAFHQADSMTYFRKGLDYAIKGGYLGLMKPTVMKLYEHSEKAGDHAAANYYTGLLARILNQEEEVKTAGTSIFMDISANDHKLDSMKLQHMYQRSVLEKKSTETIYWRYLSIFLLVVLLLLSSLLLHLFQAYRMSRSNARRLAFLQKELNARTEQLRINDDFKNKLISLIAHDFRSPLNNIVSISSFVEEDTISLEDATGMIVKVDARAKNTLQVFDGILRWMHTQLSGFTYQPEPFVVKDMVAITAETLQPILAEKQLQVVISPDADAAVMADYEMLQFVNRNLLHNATKFSEKGQAITVTVTRNKTMVTVAFSDEGTGIDPAVLPGLFSVGQTMTAKGRKGKGAGIALIICKDFIEKMNGEIWAENNPVKGATFCYSLPAAKTEA
ncbi:sensor histidine kinase KdpD [Chitinophaga sp. Cy-1792]|uniref:sensor histidine kinase n=1 Tax=Chitinophaga sp. Cy-1792 TaxID=2608339 RepID=UPI00141EA23F|nr:HAMP domain-containing sensor histidine kinase [Chitinophaga sp. Cy-1792]